MAWVALAGLLIIGIILLVGGVQYQTTTLWAGMLLAFAQSLVVGLAAWGLSLARQRAELEEVSAPSEGGGFRMNYGEQNAGSGVAPKALDAGGEIKTLDTGFQRMLVGLTAVVLMGVAAGIAYMMKESFAWARAHPDQPFPIAGAFDKPKVMDELALLIGLAAAGLYVVLFFITRRRRDDVQGTGEAVNSNFTLGVGGMIAMGVAAILGYMKVEYAAEVAAGIMVFLLALQGLELFVNCFRSFSAVEELDEEAVDLHALPLVPMLGSVWLNGLKILFAQSVGLSRTKETGVIGRMMPRAIGAFIVIAILVSCLRVVRPGEVAVLERFGYAPQELGPDGVMRVAQSAIKRPGMHLTMPWPIDQLVTIPTEALQVTNVGAPAHPKKEKSGVDFQFWTVKDPAIKEEAGSDDQFVTGDGQMLETSIIVMWRVSDAAKFYNGLSHSDVFDKGKGGEVKATPIYEALVQQCTNFAVTRAFGTHTLDDIMTVRRTEVESVCKGILQSKLLEAQSGIQVVDLTIKDLHPPYGQGEVPNPNASDPMDRVKRGPAHAYEHVTSMLEFKETLKNAGEMFKVSQIVSAQGNAAQEVNRAKAYRAEKIAAAEGEAARMQKMAEGLSSSQGQDQAFMLEFFKKQAMWRSLKDVFGPVNKIIVDPAVKDITFYQPTEKGNTPVPMRPPGQ
jgi:membrane protease subunit HflK